MSKVNRLTYVYNNYMTDVVFHKETNNYLPSIETGGNNQTEDIIINEFQNLREGITREANTLVRKLDRVSELESQITVVNRKYSTSKCEALYSTLDSYKDIQCK